jgi:tricarballylate dehydrogenase
VNSGRTYDVLVVGGGNAALCAALTARAQGSRVLILEAAPKALRGGDTRHTRNFRCMHDTPADVLTDSYREDEYWDDLLKVTGGETNERLARLVIRGTAQCRAWMGEQGVRFQPSLGGTLHLSRTNAFFLGGGKALLNAYYRAAARLGIETEYETAVQELRFDGPRFRAAVVSRNGAFEVISARSLVVASGGFQANYDWLREAWGECANNFLIRGTPYNDGKVLRHLMDLGVRTVGKATECHAVAIDARSPRFDGGIITRVDCISLGIVVNLRVQRFYDEGEDFWPKRYAIWGRLLAQQPGQIAFTIVDSKAIGKFMPPVYPPVQANSIRELAGQLGLSGSALENTVQSFNDAVREGEYNHAVLDNCRTEGLNPPKSHWARRIEKPPFWAYPLRPGITFTYLGVAVNERAQILSGSGDPFDNVWAAGEIMAGNILGHGYLAGIGMAIGTVFGQIAGKEAGRHAAS